mmetsp:Transcript_27684/g.40876  ORF Transcript_27684/g.40876 Transcript_27684/m.40876 type:complete len:504 (+) Transcript_27684:139-1650(+)|eukprot:CAMPEP_0195519918 /NCGR_PEP_ID=MMETSP0794_2-20130614/15775_1 /TAXON_ID=515487 /ORGANISM="Stephanopyxis turris, Strain CCMP 815" /LENGTH=503 /DNA_ID=CAMNT_0040649161 /DNA_START=131 /DNA_END=1642 /DNA_ORIENTATION=-
MEPLSSPPSSHNTHAFENEQDDSDTNDSILSLSFNQDGGCLAVGTRKGFRICNVSPFQETFRRTFLSNHTTTTTNDSGNNNNLTNDDNENESSVDGNTEGRQETVTRSNGAAPSGGGVSVVEMLFRCNLLALVGGGPNPRYPPNKVMIWDDHRGKCIGELSFRQRVLAVKLRRDRIAVALTTRVYMYNFSDLKLLDQIHTISNPLGLLALSPDPAAGTVLACPSITRGHVRLELYSSRKTVLVEAHETSLASLALSMDGTVLATASERGTVLRIFDTRLGGAPLHELRRGVERARISCLSFSMDKMWLAASSDRGTCHVFQLSTTPSYGRNAGDAASSQQQPKSKRKSGGGGFASFVPKFARPYTVGDVESSFAQIRGIEDPAVCAFVPDAPNTLAVVGKTGSLLISNFSKGGESERVAYHRFFRASASAQHNDISMERKDDMMTQDETATTYDIDSPSNRDESSANNGLLFGDEGQEDGFVSVKQAGAKNESEPVSSSPLLE